MQRPITLGAALLCCSACFATDRQVALGGTGSIYPNIGAAIAASVNGDRILVQPGTYPAFTVDRSVEILALSASDPFGVAGNVAIVATADLNVTLNGALALGSLTFTLNSFSPIEATINLTSCTFTNVDVYSGRAYLRMHACTIKGALTFVRGTVSGCRIQGDPVYMIAGQSVLTLASGTSPASIPTRRYIVGNVIGELLSSTYLPSVVTLETDAPFTVSNNLLHGSAAAAAKPAVKTKKPRENYLVVTVEDCLISSFSSRGATNNTQPWMIDSVSMFQPAFTAMVQNNFIINALPFVPTAGSWSQAYNVFSNSLGTIDASTGAPTVGSPAINSGDPSTAYLDLDLSRNDAGCWGGSWSMANFLATGPSAKVAMVWAPRTATSGQSLAITAAGFER